MSIQHTARSSCSNGDERMKEAQTHDKTACPECDGTLIEDPERGETVCEDCGLVIETDEIDRGPEWRAFDATEHEEKARVGAPTSPLLHDKGLSTNIGWQNRDASGRSLSANKRKQMGRLRTWHERCRTRSATDRNLKQAFGEINRMASALGLPQSVRETASVIYRRAVEEELLIGRSIEGVATAALYAAARQEAIPRTLDEMTTVARVEYDRIARAYRAVAVGLELAIEPTDPTAYLPRFTSELDCSEATRRQAREFLESVTDTHYTSGKHPAGLAASALYAATCVTGDRHTQQEIGNVADVTAMTIRTHYRDFLDNE